MIMYANPQFSYLIYIFEFSLKHSSHQNADK